MNLALFASCETKPPPMKEIAAISVVLADIAEEERLQKGWRAGGDIFTLQTLKVPQLYPLSYL